MQYFLRILKVNIYTKYNVQRTRSSRRFGWYFLDHGIVVIRTPNPQTRQLGFVFSYCRFDTLAFLMGGVQIKPYFLVCVVR